MGKRASIAGKAAASPAKRQRTPADPLMEACAPVLQVLKSAGGGRADETSAVDLLCAGFPCALRVAEGAQTRHAYQEKMLDAVASELSGFVTSRKESVAAIEAQLSALDAEKAESTSISAEITARLSEKTKERHDASEAHQKQQEIVKQAQSAIEAAKESAASADGEKQAMEKDRDYFTSGLTELWEPLKTSAIGGAQWRQRDKLLSKLLDNMRAAEAEPALLAALPVALKVKADARSEFALTTVAHSENIYTRHIEVLKANVENFGSEINTRASAVAEAESFAKSAQEALDAAMDADIAADNACAEVEGEDNEHKAKMKGFAPTQAKLETQLEQAKADLAHLEEVVKSFEALRPVSAVLKTVSGTEEDAEVPAEVVGATGEETVQTS